jgi:hypothetical protein
MRCAILLASILPKLEIGTVDDPLEHEAARVTAQLTRTPAPELCVAHTPLQLRRKRTT